jgi:hypothetical protein
MPVEVLHTWIEESFRAVAPKSVIKLLDASKEREGTASASPDV